MEVVPSIGLLRGRYGYYIAIQRRGSARFGTPVVGGTQPICWGDAPLLRWTTFWMTSLLSPTTTPVD